MKLSFSLSSSKSSSSSRPPPAGAARDGAGGREERAAASSKVEFVTEFDPAVTLASDASLPAAIAPLANTDSWRVPKRMKNLEPPPSADLESTSAAVADRFELDTSQADSGNATYGLILRKSEAAGGSREGIDSDLGVNADAGAAVRSEPVLSAEQKLREDIEKLPEDRGFEEFEDISVEDFSKALLAGYGWKTGQGIGRNAKEDTKVKEYKRWAGNGGIGFKSEAPKEKERKKERDNLPPVPPTASSRQAGDNGAQNGVSKIVRIISGEYAGMKAEVLRSSRHSHGKIILRLLRSGAEAIVREESIAELGSAEEQRFFKKTKKAEHREERDVSWLRSHIRVRIISKNLKNGRLYRKKGKVVDVVGPMICDLSMDESGELLQGVGQEILETVLPPRGGPVLVLFGKHKGSFGNLMEKDSEKETAVVRDADSHELIRVRLEQIAEYVGDPDALGY